PGSRLVSAGLPDFCMMATPSPLAIPPGGSDAAAIEIETAGGFTDSVNLTLAGLPKQVTANFYPATATTAGSILSLNVGSKVKPADYTLTITARSGTLAHTAQLVLRVLAPGQTAAADSSRPGRLFVALRAERPGDPPPASRALAGMHPLRGSPPRPASTGTLRGVTDPVTLLDEVGRRAFPVPAVSVRAW